VEEVRSARPENFEVEVGREKSGVGGRVAVANRSRRRKAGGGRSTLIHGTTLKML
jgi:hypothetical protein